MTTAAFDQSTQASLHEGVFLNPVHDAIAAAAHELAATCLLESSSGQIVAHHVSTDAPAAVNRAVLARSSLELQHATKHRRTVAVFPSGPVQSLKLDGHAGRVLVAPIVNGGLRLGWLWAFLPPRLPCDLEALRVAVVNLAHAASGMLTPSDEGLLSCLFDDDGARLPLHLRTSGLQAWVVAVQGPDNAAGAAMAGSLSLAVRGSAWPDVSTAIAASDAVVYLALGARKPQAVEKICRWVECLLSSVTDAGLRAGLSVPTVMTPRLGVSRRQAELALAASEVASRCVSLTSHRSAAVLRQACAAIDSLPDLGTDPLRSLFDYDARAKTGLAPTLLAWLEAHGDVALAAARLSMHHNTFRYRLARARAVIAADLDDPAVRLEVHLRLRSIRDFRAVDAGE